jgi:hypothetical protein
MEEHSHSNDEIHMPAPSIAPLLLAAGMTLTLVGLLSTPLLVIGVILLIAGIGLWVLTQSS